MRTRLPNFSVKIPYNVVISTVDKLKNLCGGQCVSNLGRGLLLPTGNAVLICWDGGCYIYGEDQDIANFSFDKYPFIPKKEFLEIINFMESEGAA